MRLKFENFDLLRDYQKLIVQIKLIGRLDSYQLSFAQIVQNICLHLCKALKYKHLQRFELNSTLSRR